MVSATCDTFKKCDIDIVIILNTLHPEGMLSKNWRSLYLPRKLKFPGTKKRRTSPLLSPLESPLEALCLVKDISPQ